MDRWGHAVLDGASGEVDRAALAKIVFADEAQRRRLEDLTHPWVEQRRRELFAAASAQPQPPAALVIDAPLLLEAGLQRECDAIIFVDAPEELRARRVRESRGWSDQQRQSREAAQMPLERKRAAADHVIVNRGNLAELRAAVAATLQRIIAAGQADRRPGTAARRDADDDAQ